jgi:hypothetical protein
MATAPPPSFVFLGCLLQATMKRTPERCPRLRWHFMACGSYSPALAANVPTTAMFGRRSCGKP